MKISLLGIPCTIDNTGKHMLLNFPYNPALIPVVKLLDHKGFEPSTKSWKLAKTKHNMFQLKALSGKPVYDSWTPSIQPITSRFPLMQHQEEMVNYLLQNKRCLWAVEMGLGKSLAAIASAELADVKTVWYVGPLSGVHSFKREVVKWASHLNYEYMTYERFTRNLKEGIQTFPDMIIADESSKLKTPSAQRSQQMKYLCDNFEGYVVFMTGTPSPNNPSDWWSPCNMLQEGFLIESTVNKLKYRLANIIKVEEGGCCFPKLLNWWDDEERCQVCGEYEDHDNHKRNFNYGDTSRQNQDYHSWQKSENKVEQLHDRLQGLVYFKQTKDCVDLPELRIEVRRVKPAVETLKHMKAILKTSSRAITALSRCRQLSDGFLYEKTSEGTKPCPECGGTGEADGFLGEHDMLSSNIDVEYERGVCECIMCEGTGVLDIIKRTAKTYKNAKLDELTEIAVENEETGRLIVWAGFKQSVEMLTKHMGDNGWAVLRIDGNGRVAHNTEATVEELMDCMDNGRNTPDLKRKYPKVCVVANPQAASMAYTFHSARTAVYFSNVFNGESRMQSLKRHHRIGMSGSCAIVIDLVMLQTDQLILDNLSKKVKLQNMTMNGLQKELQDV